MGGGGAPDVEETSLGDLLVELGRNGARLVPLVDEGHDLALDLGGEERKQGKDGEEKIGRTSTGRKGKKRTNSRMNLRRRR